MQLFPTESLSLQRSCKHMSELRVLAVLLAVDLATTFGQEIFQLPQIRGFVDLTGHWLGLLHHFVKLPIQSI